MRATEARGRTGIHRGTRGREMFTLTCPPPSRPGLLLRSENSTNCKSKSLGDSRLYFLNFSQRVATIFDCAAAVPMREFVMIPMIGGPTLCKGALLWSPRGLARERRSIDSHPPETATNGGSHCACASAGENARSFRVMGRAPQKQPSRKEKREKKGKKREAINVGAAPSECRLVFGTRKWVEPHVVAFFFFVRGLRASSPTILR